ncbi:hypothetical protein B5F53_12030 [Blautia sp. An249]|uniref:hypothetical protein n=1 Tax=Blautia sp. An249 TaxID=1965603 RepID=UPI000B374AD3|nr:hypothetical protein [Blautia sp. An249]OUO77933.1 hypothetical protein B5F53_12030 [Blautia sp. An249]
MTIEQLEIGNKILEKIQKYKDFQKSVNVGIISCVEYELKKDSDIVETHISHLDISDSKNIIDMIGDYISGRIKELEKQLEEL